jgi:hypothetical protein
MTPVYNLAILPAPKLPFTSRQEAKKKYLGGRTVDGQQYATLNIFIKNNTEAIALYDFWATDCNYGTIPFEVVIPMFGEIGQNTLVEFTERFSMDKINAHWDQSFKVKVLGVVI